MKIEIEEIDYREIMDKLGGIKSAALMAKMGTEREQAIYFNDTIRWAGEITVRLNNGIMVPRTTAEIELQKENKELRELVKEATEIMIEQQSKLQEILSEGQNERSF